ncbi:MAG: hypothetical protein A3F70_10390 [Acidobacteria bacterium RIFCSPLOWO2_12_FULL_67_14]|nr:MAG: hypothetical protein A3F70_10390 [Acidobacteria bacterium RIFCSPLOWO2_12_FULL_67_14]
MRVLISCGEPSGDLYAGALAAELSARVPSIEIAGFGGPRLRAAGASLLGDFTGLTVTGLTEALRVLPRSYAMYRRLVGWAREHRPDVFVPIDFPDFNFRVMAALRRVGIPVVYYVSPQLWAWRPRRMETMRRSVDRVLVIFPFEAPLYERAGIDVRFVGHPLVDLARGQQPRPAFLRGLGLNPDAPTVALLPGSRPSELRHIAPGMAAALPLIAARVPNVQFVVAAAPGVSDALLAPLVGRGLSPLDSARGDPELVEGSGARPTIVVVRDRADDVLAAADVVVTASGTATVQAALHERPMIVVYRLSPLTYAIGKPFVRVSMYAMPNLVAGTAIVPELIQEAFTPERVAAEVVDLLTNPARYAGMQERLRQVRGAFGEAGASGRAADAVLEVAARHARGATPA